MCSFNSFHFDCVLTNIFFFEYSMRKGLCKGINIVESTEHAYLFLFKIRFFQNIRMGNRRVRSWKGFWKKIDRWPESIMSIIWNISIIILDSILEFKLITHELISLSLARSRNSNKLNQFSLRMLSETFNAKIERKTLVQFFLENVYTFSHMILEYRDQWQNNWNRYYVK